MTTRSAFAVSTLAATCILIGSWAAPLAAQSLTIASWGGSYTDSQRATYYEPFSQQYEVAIKEAVWDNDIQSIQRQVMSGEYLWNIVDAQQDAVLDGCDLGLLEFIDYGLMGGREAFMEGAALDCGVGTVTWSTIYAYNGDTLTGEPPMKIEDFFDLEKFLGKRGLYRSPKIALEWALISDGVPKSRSGKLLNRRNRL